MDDYIIIDTEGCSRCHAKGHAQLMFFKLARPVQIEAPLLTLTHWALCPRRQEPILLTVSEVDAPLAPVIK